MRVRRTTMATLALATAIVLLGAAVAGGTRYVTDRDRLPVRAALRVDHRAITKLLLDAPYRCGDGARGFVGYRRGGGNEPVTIRVGRRGRFHFRDGRDDTKWEIEGRVFRDRIRGRFLNRSRSGVYACWTGRSRTDPWVDFVARRKYPPQPLSR